MTVASAISRVSYAGNGSTTAFSVPYYFLENGHLQVILSVSGVNTVQTITTNYTVTGAGNPAGGTVTMLVAPAAGTQLTIVRDVPATQETDYTANDPFPAESHERALDKLTMLVQENDVRIARAVRGPVTDSDAINMILPAAAERADGILQFDTNGAVDVVSTDQFIAGLSGAIIGANYVTVSSTGNGVTTAFTVSPAPGAKGNIQIYINGAYQNKATFSLSGTTVNFTQAPPLNADIEFVIGDSLSSTSGEATGIDFTQQGTGAQTRTVANKLYEFVSVKDFGAVGDGTTDDTAAIQAAYNAVNTVDGSQGVFFPSGTYLISDTIDCTPNFGTTVPQMLGEGADTSKIVADAGFGAKPLFYHVGGSPSPNSKWQGVSIIGTGAADGQWGIHHVNTCFVNYDGIYFSALESGIRFENEGGGFTEQNVLTNSWCVISYYFISFARQVGSTQDSFRGTGFASECHMDLTTYTQARMMRVYYLNTLACNCYNTPINGSIWIGSAQAVMQNDGNIPIRSTGTLRYETSANPWTFGTGSALVTDYFTGVLSGISFNPVGNTCQLTGFINQNAINETGTFTPTLTASGGTLATTYAVAGQQGFYSLNGKICTFQIFFNVTSASGGTGDVGISGFPFTAATLPISGGVSPVSFTPVYPTGITYTNQLLLGAIPLNTYQLIYTAPSGGSLTNFQWASMPASFSMRIYGSFIVA